MNPSLILSLILAEWRAHPARLLASVLAVAAGVALFLAVDLVNTSALSEFGAAVRSIKGEADLEITGPRSGFDETVFDRVAQMPGVEVASPVIERDLMVIAPRPARGATERAAILKVIGIDVYAAGALGAALVGKPELEDERPIIGEGLYLSRAAREWLAVKSGDFIELGAGESSVRLRVVGDVPNARAGERLGVMDIGAAAWRLQSLGRLQRIDVKLAPGTAREAFVAQLRPLLPAGVNAALSEEGETRLSNISLAYRVNLNMLAMVALFTGGFIVLATQMLSVARRQQQWGLLCVMGMTRGEVLAQILLEGAMVGLLGALAGVALGIAVAWGLLLTLGGDLGSGFFAGGKPALVFDARAVALAALLGVVTAIIGSARPALAAAHAAPAQALKGTYTMIGGRSALGAILGALSLCVGGAFAWLPPVGGVPLFGYLSVALMLSGAIALVPAVTPHIVRAFAATRYTSAPWGLAVTRLCNAPQEASLALAGILASFSLMIAMAIMVGSFRQGVSQWLERILPADMYVRAAAFSESARFSLDEQRVLAEAARDVQFYRVSSLNLDAARTQVALIIRPLDQDHPEKSLPITGALVPVGDAVPVWVSEAMVDLYGMKPGVAATLPLAGKNASVRVAGVWRDYARQFGAVVIRSSDYARLTGETWTTDAGVWLKPGQTPADYTAAVRAAMPSSARLEFNATSDIRVLSLKLFDRSFAITYVLEAIAILIGLYGVAASFAGQTLLRAKEFGMLQHIGLTGSEIMRMVTFEGLLITGVGALMGLALGWGLSLVLVHVINPQSFHWTMDVVMPWPLIAAVSASLVLCGTWVTRRAAGGATQRDLVRSVRDDW